jgi:UDP-N-acetylmuramate: L-alanyl-gamma-D-glutamyl-meso-diaminopimelate ligase
VPFSGHPAKQTGDKTCLLVSSGYEIPITVFGNHNLRNIAAARAVCLELGLDSETFYKHIAHFKGPAKRLQKLAENTEFTVFLDFAHAPSKVSATVDAVRNQYPVSQLVAVFELHTFSSLNKNFLQGYRNSLSAADRAMVYFNPGVIEHKRLAPITTAEVVSAFESRHVEAADNFQLVSEWIKNTDKAGKHTVFLFMSSGNFDGQTGDALVKLCMKPD